MIDALFTVEAFAVLAMETLGCSSRLRLQLGTDTVDILCDDPSTLQEYANYYGPFALAPSLPLMSADLTVQLLLPDVALPTLDWHPRPRASGERIKEDTAQAGDGRFVRKRATGMVFAFDKTWNLAVGDCRKYLPQVVNFINGRLMDRKIQQGFLVLHASGVALKGKGLALAGVSGAGKSTLALHLMHGGADFVSNDRLLVRCDTEGWIMHGLAKHPRINPGTVLHNPTLRSLIPNAERRELEHLSSNELWSLERKYDAPIHTLFGLERFRLDAPLHGLVLLTWTLQTGPVLSRQVDWSCREDLIPLLRKTPGIFSLPDGSEPEGRFSDRAYADCLRHIPTLELFGGVDFPRAIDLVSEWALQFR